MAVRDVVQAAAGALGGGGGEYIEDVFSTYLYTGNGSSQTITNGIDLDGEGGLVWVKGRTGGSTAHCLVDTVRGANNVLLSYDTSAQFSQASVNSFTNNGFTIPTSSLTNTSSVNYASWTFRKAPKFFDVVTYSGTGSNPRTISHNLGSTPGCIIVKETNASSNWAVWHRSLGDGYRIFLNLTNASTNAFGVDWFGTSNTTITDTNFSVGNNLNTSGRTYVAYLFAHDAGGFGDDGTENVISCGSFTTDGSGAATVTLGFEPQWAMFKCTSTSQSWFISDSMRGMPVGSADAYLVPNTSGAENTYEYISPTATGFTISNQNVSATYIYIAIRRGPMKTPESGTEVFEAYTASSTSTNQVLGSVPHDLVWSKQRTETNNSFLWDRIRGSKRLITESSAAEDSTIYVGFDQSNGTRVTSGIGSNPVYELFRRAPGFFDVVAYTGAGGVQTVTHSLGVAPELMIIKHRNGPDDWPVYHSALGNTKYLWLNSSNAESNLASQFYWNNTTPTSSVFTLGGQGRTNDNGGTYIAYLFATLAGVSKVGSYTGTAADLNVDCGFSAGARFILIKRTDSTGDWYFWDSARGITAGNDPYLLLNSTAAEVTSTDYIDPLSSGFTVTSAAPAALNASGGSYIFLAIA